MQGAHGWWAEPLRRTMEVMESQVLTKAGKDDRRDAIVQIAKEVFAANGYAGTSMSLIAARVGGSKGTLYNHFKSKEELFVAVIEKKCSQIQRLLTEAQVESGGDLRATLTNFGEHFLELILSDDSIETFRLATAEAARFPEIGRAIYQSGVRQSMRRTAELLEHAKAARQLRADADVLVAAEQFHELCLAGIHRRRLWNVETQTPAGIRTNVANAVDTFMRAFGA
jgi:TetR/AcrR family transcriptional repressor of mexJK operon